MEHNFCQIMGGGPRIVAVLEKRGIIVCINLFKLTIGNVFFLFFIHNRWWSNERFNSKELFRPKCHYR